MVVMFFGLICTVLAILHLAIGNSALEVCGDFADILSGEERVTALAIKPKLHVL